MLIDANYTSHTRIKCIIETTINTCIFYDNERQILLENKIVPIL